MAFAILVRGPNNTEATLTAEQVDASNPIILELMNQQITAKKADKLITERCAEAGIPLVFVPAQPRPAR